MRDFAIIFDAEAEGNDEAIATQDFASTWGWFGVMHRLCGEDISKLESITKLNLLNCLTWLSSVTAYKSNKRYNW